MSSFTITPPPKSTVITLEEGLKGQVDIMGVAPDGTNCRLAAFGNGKLHLFRFSPHIAKSFGLHLDASNYPIVDYL